jgi:hypothetical protein
MSSSFPYSLTAVVPPSTLGDAKLSLQQSLDGLSALTRQIDDEQAALKEFVAQTEARIAAFSRDKSILEEQITAIQGFLAPIRKLPAELLREIFFYAWQDYPCVGWVVASVCRDWRRVGLAMSIIWSKASSSSGLLLLTLSFFPHTSSSLRVITVCKETGSSASRFPFPIPQ